MKSPVTLVKHARSEIQYLKNTKNLKNITLKNADKLLNENHRFA